MLDVLVLVGINLNVKDSRWCGMGFTLDRRDDGSMMGVAASLWIDIGIDNNVGKRMS